VGACTLGLPKGHAFIKLGRLAKIV
jgi:hypothetical protein